MSTLKIANFLAKNSCDKWQESRIKRRLCRFGYRLLARLCARPDRTFHAEPVDTYPWLYRDEDFAPWEENDQPGSYTLISDPSNFVIRHCTSYCAWKIKEQTGRWTKSPKTVDHRVRSGQHTWDARFWREYLANNGYTKVDPIPYLLYNYVGISPRGEFGEVVWFERLYDLAGRSLVSTYVNQKYLTAYVHNSAYIWVRIEPPAYLRFYDSMRYRLSNFGNSVRRKISRFCQSIRQAISRFFRGFIRVMATPFRRKPRFY